MNELTNSINILMHWAEATVNQVKVMLTFNIAK